MLDTITIPCPTQGCHGEIYAARERNADGTAWQILWFDDVPVVICSRSCRPPEDLIDRIEPDIRAA